MLNYLLVQYTQLLLFERRLQHKVDVLDIFLHALRLEGASYRIEVRHLGKIFIAFFFLIDDAT